MQVSLGPALVAFFSDWAGFQQTWLASAVMA